MTITLPLSLISSSVPEQRLPGMKFLLTIHGHFFYEITKLRCLSDSTGISQQIPVLPGSPQLDFGGFFKCTSPWFSNPLLWFTLHYLPKRVTLQPSHKLNAERVLSFFIIEV